MRFVFIAKNADMLPVERLCQIMDVSPRGYRAHRNRPLCESQRKDMVVLATFASSSPCLWAATADHA